ncbi:MAG: DNA repair protein RecN [Actinobacteria bacterium]|nr:MAG: DNA repair protein RecN [Actinomycetota bacterium]
MIESITISQLGGIESATVDFAPGLTVLTGETGAGKTMLLTSLELLLGRRADPGIVRQGKENAHVDGIFSLTQAAEESVIECGGTVEDGGVILSRTVAAQGRSRAHLGGRPVPAATLAGIGEQLVTIHGQADQLHLRDPHTQRRLVDSYGGAEHQALLEAYAEAWHAAVNAKRHRDEMLRTHNDRDEEIRELRSATEAISSLDIQAGEEGILRAETERLTNIQDLRVHTQQASALLSGADTEMGAVDLVTRSAEELRIAARFDSAMEDYAQRMRTAAIDLDTLNDELQQYLLTCEADPLRLAEVHERRAALRELMRGRAADAEELLQWHESACARLDELTSADFDPEVLEEKLVQAQQEVLRIGQQLSDSRRAVVEKLETQVDRELHSLALPHAHLRIMMPERTPCSHGLEDVELFFQSHTAVEARPLGRAASGGELSRVMLALEVVLGAQESTPTYIFDEVDAGIGGVTALEVGRRLAKLSRTHQVIVVTHLPQVAAFAHHHLVVEKNGATTTVHEVSGETRIDEIARMMGAKSTSNVARRHAQELLEAANVPQSAM